VTAAEAYELTTQGGATDFARLIDACQSFGSYCLIGGLAVNCYVEPVYTLDADLVVITASLPKLAVHLQEQGFKIEEHPHSPNVGAPGSDLRIQFTTDERYQAFLSRSVEGDVLGLRVKVASVEDIAQGKLWAYGDPRRRLSKRKKDELDLIRLAEAYPALKALYPSELIAQIDRG
jgi:translation elongation factor EF-1alpha